MLNTKETKIAFFVGMLAGAILLAGVAVWVSFQKYMAYQFGPRWTMTYKDSAWAPNHTLSQTQRVESVDQVIAVRIVSGNVSYRRADGQYQGFSIDACPLMSSKIIGYHDYSLDQALVAPEIPSIAVDLRNQPELK